MDASADVTCGQDELYDEVSRACVCKSGLTQCDGSCVDTQTNTSHCGQCSQVCIGNRACNAGSCDVVSQVSVGTYYTCALKHGGQLACWGQNLDGHAPQSGRTFTQISAGLQHTCGIRVDGSVKCWGANIEDLLDAPGGEFVQISANLYHTCGVKSDGLVACWGNGNDGRLTPPPGEKFTQVSAGGSHTCGIKTDGRVSCWGLDDKHQASPPEGW